jgi:O-methyltransferase
MRGVSSIVAAVRRYRHNRDRLHIYQNLKRFTMIPPHVFGANLALADRVRQIKGCVVECGVWRGGMSAGIARCLGPSRKYYLFDSFEGLPPAKAIDGTAALKWQQNTESAEYFENCWAPVTYAKEAMKQVGATNAEFVKGWFEDTIPKHHFDEPIALLRLDGDWYESTMVCLTNLFDRVAPGGLIIIDDYYAWDGCSRAVHDFLSSRSASERIESLEAVCFMVKAAAAPEH